MTTKRTNTDILKGLVAEGMKMHYGDKPEKQVKLRILWELKHIIDAGYVDYYVMAFWIFRHMTQSKGIKVWARGAMPSSIVCYCLGLTEVDPVKYGLHSVRFVNNELPKFQFDVEASRFDEFMQGAEEMLDANKEDVDVDAIRPSLFYNIMRASYLSKEKQRLLPEDMDDELARYALRMPQTMELYNLYVWKKANGPCVNRHRKLGAIVDPTCGLLVYQEQMLDILRQIFHVSGINANHIRRSIQKGEWEKVEAYKKEIFANLEDLTESKAERVWQVLTSNRSAFIKAHAVSCVLASYKYEI